MERTAGDQQFAAWYHWAGVPADTPYLDADRMVADAVSRLEADRDELRVVIERIIDVARAGAWYGPEVPAPVAVEIAHARLLLRRREPA